MIITCAECGKEFVENGKSSAYVLNNTKYCYKCFMNRARNLKVPDEYMPSITKHEEEVKTTEVKRKRTKKVTE